MKWTLLAAGILGLLSTCSNSKSTMISTNRDTSLLYKLDTPFIAGIVPAVLRCDFSQNARAEYKDRLKTVLLLENPVLVTAPEGVYELYITNGPPETNHLSSSDKGFVNVLDLYSLTAPGAKQLIEVDISKPIIKLFRKKQSLVDVYISIRFGPVKMPDGSFSGKAGELRLSGIQIVQVNN